ncbi:hypothetical protein HanIR_Chr05g0244351 [Helianthus annuus]|nr:hypothetical protein HanIR_Chr05g0244351 [Helianthus annuus]
MVVDSVPVMATRLRCGREWIWTAWLVYNKGQQNHGFAFGFYTWE